MAYTPTSLLSLPIITTGSESGLWGDVTNNGLTQYLDIAIAGRNALTSANFTAGALTLANTAGTNSTTNIAATSAQYSTLYVSSLATNSTITAPSSNRNYLVINADSTYTLTVKASGQTGITFSPGQSGLVAFNGTDYALVGTIGPTVPVARGGTGISSGTSGGVPYFSASTTIASSAALAANAIVIGGGAGVAPATTTTGSGVVTAIGNSTNAASGLAVLNASGNLNVAQGGTGAGTFTANNVLLGNGTSAFQTVAPGTTGNVLTSNGTTWTSSAPAAAGGTATFTSSGAITAGDPVALNSDGTVSTIASTASSGPSVSTVFSSGAYYPGAFLYHWPTGNFIAFTVNSSGNAVRYATGVYSAGSVTWTDQGTLASLPYSPNNNRTCLSACVSPDGNYVVLGMLRNSDLVFMTFTVSGTTVSYASGSAQYTTIGNNAYLSSLNVDYCPRANAYLWAGNGYSSSLATYIAASSSFTLSGATISLTTSSYYYFDGFVNMSGTSCAVVCPGTGTTIVTGSTASSQTRVVRFSFGRNGAQIGSISYPSRVIYTSLFNETNHGGAYDSRTGFVYIMAGASMITLGDSVGVVNGMGLADSGVTAYGIGAAYNRYTQDIFILSKGTNTNDWSYTYTTRGGGGSTTNFRAETGLSSLYNGDRYWSNYGQCGAPDGAMLVTFPQNGSTGAHASFLFRPPTSTYNRFVGIATSSVSSGASVTITVAGGINTQQSGLITGTPYYINPNGGLTYQNTNVFAGIATSSTAIILGG